MAGVWSSQPVRLHFRCTVQQFRGRPLINSKPKSTSATQPKGSATEKLNWPEYLAIRGGKRRWQTVGVLYTASGLPFKLDNQAFTIPCALIGFFGGATYFGTLETDPTKPIMASVYNLRGDVNVTHFTGY